MSGYIVNYANINIVNNGYLTLPYGTDPTSAINFSGSGSVAIDNGTTASNTVFDNQGNMSSIISLEETDVIVENYYSWTKGTDGVYTLKLYADTFLGTINIDVEDVIIELTQDVTVDSLYIDKRDATYINVMLTGGYTL